MEHLREHIILPNASFVVPRMQESLMGMALTVISEKQILTHPTVDRI